MKSIYIFILLFIASCSEPAIIDMSLLKTAVISASVLTYEDLDEETKKSIGSSARFYKADENWNEGTSFEPKNGYYVSAKIMRKKLAIVSNMYSCGSVTKIRQCSKNELDEKTNKLLSYSNPYMLYGKYKNIWGFEGKSEEMPATKKFDGHGLINISKLENGEVDEVLIGPLPQKPITLMIIPYDRYRSDYVIKHSLQP